MKYIKLFIIAGILAGAVCLFLFLMQGGDGGRDGDVVSLFGETSRERDCSLVYFCSGSEWRRDTLTDQNSGRFRFELTDSKGAERNNSLQKDWQEQDGKKFLVHKITLSDDEGAMPLKLVVSYVAKSDSVFQLVERQITRSNFERGDTVGVDMGVLLSQLKWYDEMSDPRFEFTDETERKARGTQIWGMPESKYRSALLTLFNQKFSEPIVVEQPKKKNSAPGKTSSSTVSDVLVGNSWYTIEKLRAALAKTGNDALQGANKKRAEAMLAALEKVAQLQVVPPKVMDGLDDVQKRTILKYNEVVVSEYRAPYDYLKKKRVNNLLTSFKQIWDVIQTLENNNVN